MDMTYDLLLSDLVNFFGQQSVIPFPKLLTILFVWAFISLKANTFKAVVRKLFVFILSLKKKRNPEEFRRQK